MKRLSILAAVVIFSGWAFATTPALASGCISGSLLGTCKASCDADKDEIDANDLIVKYPDELQPSGVCNQVCCVAKSQTLCLQISTYKTTPINKVGNWFCSKPCVGTPLAQYAGIETCDKGTICCDTANTSPGTGGSAAATKGSSGSAVALTNPLGAGTTIFTVINRVITAFLGMIGALALGVFVYSGVLWMTAGSSDRVQKAKDAMKYAVIGLAMIAFSYAITTFFLTAFTKTAPANQPGANVQEAIPLGE